MTYIIILLQTFGARYLKRFFKYCAAFTVAAYFYGLLGSFVVPASTAFAIDGPTLSFAKFKSSFTLRLLNFVNTQAKSKNINICIAGDSIMVGLTNQQLLDRPPQKPTSVTSLTRTSDITHCNVVYISSDYEFFEALQQKVKDVPGLLTVSDRKDFSRKTGVVEFLIVEGKPRFIVNLKNAKKKNLSIKSDLLQMAAEVI